VRGRNLSIHDTDIQRWALAREKVENIDNFVVGDTWLLNFKRRTHIRLRKVTKFISKHEVFHKEEITQAGEEFVNFEKYLAYKQNLDPTAN